MATFGIEWDVMPFRKSSFSGTNGGNCVEIAWVDVPFRKSSFSDTNGGNCVEIGVSRDLVGVRDSKSPTAGVLELPSSAWALFANDLKSDRP